MINLSIQVPDNNYTLYIGKALLQNIGNLLSDYKTKHLTIISDENVWRLHGDTLISNLCGFTVTTIILPAGEQSKSLSNLEQIYNTLAQQETKRDDPILAFGGGVVGDLAGLAAATYMRGIPLIQIPTTLLAQVDSSVGGKVAVNLENGKNLVGAFYQPKMVLADTEVLQTLPERDFCSGMAEVIKYAGISPDLAIDSLRGLQNNAEALETIIYTCCDIKRKYVEKDEKDTGERMILNFGHSFGHAIEKIYRYETYTHGEAVSIGMVLAAKMGEALHITQAGTAQVLSDLLASHNLPTQPSIPLEQIISRMSNDKKNTDGKLTLILLNKLGEPIIYQTTMETLQKVAAQSCNPTKSITKFPKGVVTIPPSKSVSHRAIICAALSQGTSRIQNVQLSDDIRATLTCVEQLGAQYKWEKDELIITGGLTKTENQTLDCAESGSTLRFLIPLAVALGGTTNFTGRGRLMQRPLTPYITTLQENGATITLTNDILTTSGSLQGTRFTLPGNISSQYITGLLLTLPLLPTGGTIILTSPLESSGYVDITIDVMKSFGVTVVQTETEYIVSPGQTYKPCQYTIEADFSQAAFFLVASVLGNPIECVGLTKTSKQGDRKIVDILKTCGATLQTGEHNGIIATADRLTATTIDVSEIPDLVPPLAVLLAFCEGESQIINAARLRLKESDRLNALATELSKLGIVITQKNDSLQITGTTKVKGGTADAWNDHRIAMAIAVASIRSESTVQLSGYTSVSKSYPTFWEDFEKEAKPNGQYMG